MFEDHVCPFDISSMTRVTSYADVGAVLACPNARQALHRCAESQAEWGRGLNDGFTADSVISLDGDAHVTRRRIESKLFTKDARARFEFEIVLPTLRDILKHQLEAEPNGEAELLVFTRLTLMRLSAAVIGLPSVDDLETAERLRAVADTIGNAIGVDWVSDDQEGVLAGGFGALEVYDREFYRPGRAAAAASYNGSDGLLSVLLASSEMIDSPDVLFREAVLYLVASSGTTTHALPHAVWDLEGWLRRHSDARSHLSDFGFCRRVASEALRLHPPVPALWRHLTQPLALPSGREIEAGTFVYVDLDASARDIDAFGANAEAFDPMRSVPRGIWPYAYTFGGGAHVCIGRTLAIGDASADRDPGAPQGILTRLLHEFYRWGLELDPERMPLRREGTAQAQYESFPVRFTCPPVPMGQTA